MTTFPYPKYDPGTVLRENKRYFGKFECDYCARWWKSGNSWLGFGQNCTGCGELTYPWKLSYLKAPPITDPNEIEKRHLQENCERCKRLGYYCRESENENIQSNREGARNRNRSKNRNRKNKRTNREKSITASTTPQTIQSSSSNPTNLNASYNADPTPVRNVVNSTKPTCEYFGAYVQIEGNRARNRRIQEERKRKKARIIAQNRALEAQQRARKCCCTIL